MVTADSILTEGGFVTIRGLKIKGGDIDAMPEKASVLSPIEKIDYKGCAITPCFCDYHLHFFKQRGNHERDITNDLRTSGITKVYDGGSQDLYGIQLREKSKNNISIKTSGCALYKRGSYGNYIGKEIGGIKEAEELIDVLIESGVDYLKIINSGVYMPETGTITEGGFDFAEIESIVSYAQSKGMSVACHANGEAAARDAAAAGVNFIIHGLFLPDETLALMAEKSIAFIPTINAFARLKKISKTREAGRNIDAIVDLHLAAVQRAFDRGVNVLPGSDAGASFIPYGQSYLEELFLFQKAGIPTEKIFMSAAAGKLEKGGTADFLVLEGLSVKKVYINGKPFFSS